jgi:hypothetical protein
MIYVGTSKTFCKFINVILKNKLPTIQNISLQVNFTTENDLNRTIRS